MLAGSDYPIEIIEPLVGLARLVGGHSERAGFCTAERAPANSRLDLATAFGLLTDQAAGDTLLTADPRLADGDDVDRIEVRGTAPRPFEHHP